MKEIIKTNVTFLIQTLIVVLSIYFLIHVFKPSTTLSYEDRTKLDSLNNRISVLFEKQKKLDTTISLFESEVKIMFDSISKIKQEKIIIRKTYYEEINRVSNFTDIQVDSFFTNKYGFTPR